jgi:ribosome-associated protein
MADQPDPSASEPATLALRGDHITLAQALKAVGAAGSGAQAKHLVRDGGVTVNGSAATQPGRKLRPGDRFGIAGGPEWTITA